MVLQEETVHISWLLLQSCGSGGRALDFGGEDYFCALYEVVVRMELRGVGGCKFTWEMGHPILNISSWWQLMINYDWSNRMGDYTDIQKTCFHLQNSLNTTNSNITVTHRIWTATLHVTSEPNLHPQKKWDTLPSGWQDQVNESSLQTLKNVCEWSVNGAFTHLLHHKILNLCTSTAYGARSWLIPSRGRGTEAQFEWNMHLCLNRH